MKKIEVVLSQDPREYDEELGAHLVYSCRDFGGQILSIEQVKYSMSNFFKLFVDNNILCGEYIVTLEVEEFYHSQLLDSLQRDLSVKAIDGKRLDATSPRTEQQMSR